MVTKPRLPNTDISRMTILLALDTKYTLARVAFETHQNVSAMVRDIIETWLATTTLPRGVSVPRRLAKRHAARARKRCKRPKHTTATTEEIPA